MTNSYIFFFKESLEIKIMLLVLYISFISNNVKGFCASDGIFPSTFDFALFIHVQLKFFINNKLINIMQDHLLSVMVSCCFFDNLAIDLNLVVLPEFLRLVFSKCTLLVPNLLGL